MGAQQGEDQQQHNEKKRDGSCEQLVLFSQEEKTAEEGEWIRPEKQRTA
jgi:hypothetical protein